MATCSPECASGLCEIEEQDLGGFLSGERDGRFVFKRSSVPGFQTLIDEPDSTRDHVEPGAPSHLEFMHEVMPLLEQ
jgi:hypothetical protein